MAMPLPKLLPMSLISKRNFEGRRVLLAMIERNCVIEISQIRLVLFFPSVKLRTVLDERGIPSITPAMADRPEMAEILGP
jgi:hypothetical protein